MAGLWHIEQKHTWNQFRVDSKYEPLAISDQSFEGRDLSGYCFQNITFIRCSFERARLFDTNFRSAKLEHCSFKDAKFFKTMLEDCDVSTCFFNDWPVNCFTEGVVISEKQQKLLMGHFARLKVKES